MLGTGSSASRKSSFPLWLLRLLQPDQEATKPRSALGGLLLVWLCRFAIAEVAMQALLFRVLLPSVVGPCCCLVDDFALLHRDTGVCRQINSQATFLFSSSGDYWFLCSGGLCKFIPAHKKPMGEALAPTCVARRGFQPPFCPEAAVFCCPSGKAKCSCLSGGLNPRAVSEA